MVHGRHLPFRGVLETLSILFRPVSLSFRLFGNIFAGENVLESMMTLVPWLGWIIPLPFYFLNCSSVSSRRSCSCC